MDSMITNVQVKCYAMHGVYFFFSNSAFLRWFNQVG
jgi:hypothetical protein